MKGSRKVNAISTSRMVRAFEAVASQLELMAGGPVHLVRLVGSRVSFTAGRVPDQMPFVAPVRVLLEDGWALLCYADAACGVDRDRVKQLFQEALDGPQ